MKILSLFDGMSCAQIAINRIGIKKYEYYASEIDKHSIEVTNKNYPKTNQLGCVKKINGKDFEGIDLLIGGSPCQGFSNAGKMNNFNDERSALFFEFKRILEEVKPKYFILENVKMKKEYEDIISNNLGVNPVNINSKLVSAQLRNRLYWTNIKVDEIEDKGLLIKDVFENEIDVTERFLKKRIGTRAYKNAHNNIRTMFQKAKCLTAASQGISRASDTVIFNNDKYYIPSPEMCEKLQTVPVGYTSIASKSQRYKMLGNGFTVDVIAHILKNI